jgi:hypothetical protein
MTQNQYLAAGAALDAAGVASSSVGNLFHGGWQIAAYVFGFVALVVGSVLIGCCIGLQRRGRVQS